MTLWSTVEVVRRTMFQSQHFKGQLVRLPIFCSLVVAATLLPEPVRVSAVEGDRARLNAHLRAGEFGLAQQLAEQAPAADRDRFLGAIADSQFQAGMSSAAAQTTAAIQDGQARRAAFDKLSGRPLTGAAARGGAALADFDTLIELITTTIAPESWEDLGGTGAIAEFPTGVRVDASGLMKKIELDDGSGDLARVRTAAAESRAFGRNDVRRESPLRKVSLKHLERRLQVLDALRQPLGDDLQSLAGLYELKYILVYPESNDIVLAGPAGNWKPDRYGRNIHAETGRPCLQFDDLLVVLRNAMHGDGRFGCAITPTRERLAGVQKFLAESADRKLTPSNRDGWLNELREHLGSQQISVWGIDPRTRTARILVEADYHMKLVGLGLEEGVLGVTSYLDSLPAGGASTPMDVLRWWFTLNYDHVVASPERDAFAIRGPAVQVLGENEMLTERGERVHTGKMDERNRAFTHSFTANYESLAAKYPIYAELRNIFDLAMAAEVIRTERLSGRVDIDMEVLLADDSASIALGAAPQWVDSVMNHRIVNRTQIVVAVSGGVSVDPRKMLAAKPTRQDEQFQLPSSRNSARPEKLPADAWWWD